MKLIDASAVCRLVTKGAVLLALAAFSMLGQAVPANTTEAAPGHSAKKTAHVNHTRTKPPEMPPQEPVAIAPMTPEQLPAEPPRVSYENGQLTIDSQNSTLTAVLNAIGHQLGAQLEMPPGAATERVAVYLSGSARQAISALLDGSSLNYVIMGSPENPDGVQKVILTRLLPAPGVPQQQPVAANAPATIQFVAVANVPPPTQGSANQASSLTPGQALDGQLDQPPPGRPGATNPTVGAERQEMDCADLGLPPTCHQ